MDHPQQEINPQQQDDAKSVELNEKLAKQIISFIVSNKSAFNCETGPINAQFLEQNYTKSSKTASWTFLILISDDIKRLAPSLSKQKTFTRFLIIFQKPVGVIFKRTNSTTIPVRAISDCLQALPINEDTWHYILINKIKLEDIPSKLLPSTFRKAGYLISSLLMENSISETLQEFLEPFGKSLVKYYGWLKQPLLLPPPMFVVNIHQNYFPAQNVQNMQLLQAVPANSVSLSDQEGGQPCQNNFQQQQFFKGKQLEKSEKSKKNKKRKWTTLQKEKQKSNNNNITNGDTNETIQKKTSKKEESKKEEENEDIGKFFFQDPQRKPTKQQQQQVIKWKLEQKARLNFYEQRKNNPKKANNSNFPLDENPGIHKKYKPSNNV